MKAILPKWSWSVYKIAKIGKMQLMKDNNDIQPNYKLGQLIQPIKINYKV